MRILIMVCGLLVSNHLWAEACVIRHAKSQELLLCQQNHSTPSGLFQKGFCSTQNRQQTSEIQEQCPTGHWGVCRTAKAGNGRYRQDIFYYGDHTRHTAARQCQHLGGVWTQF